MQSTLYRRLLRDICAMAGIGDTERLQAEGVLRIDGIDVLLVCASDVPQRMAAYFELGTLPGEGREAMLRDMLAINYAIGPSCRGCLCMDAQTDKVFCALPFSLDEYTNARTVLDELTTFAAGLRNQDTPGQSTVAPDAGPRKLGRSGLEGYRGLTWTGGRP